MMLNQDEESCKREFLIICRQYKSLPKLKVRFDYFKSMVASRRYGYKCALENAQAEVSRSIRKEE